MLAAAVALFMSASAAAAPPRLPARALAVPLIAQATDYSCGAAALMSTLLYWNTSYDSDEGALYAPLGTTPKDGTPPEAIARVAESYGLHAYLAEHMTLDDLSLALERGDTVILDLQAWREDSSTRPWSADWDDGHYVVLVGMDREYAYLMDPSSFGAYAFVPLQELLERWHDYEDRTGVVRRYERLGVIVRGKKPRGSYPGALVRML
jgi:predicted double-glycine peptidase